MNIYKDVWSDIWECEAYKRIVYLSSDFDLRVGDCIVLREVDINGNRTGKEMTRRVERVHPNAGVAVLEINPDRIINST